MIALGTKVLTVLTAQRSQLKKMNHPRPQSKVIFPVASDRKRKRESIDDEDDSIGFPLWRTDKEEESDYSQKSNQRKW